MTSHPAAHDGATIVDTITGSLRPIRRAALGLGSNLGESLDNLQGAVTAFLDTPDVFAYAVSPVYETDPVGGPDQEDYLNAVLVIDTTLSAQNLLERAHAIEEAFGRDRSREERWGPRTLDIDVLAVGELTAGDGDAAAGVQVPHPRLHERAFVLVPWNDVDPSFAVPGHGPVHDLLVVVGTDGVRRRADLFLTLS